MTEQEKKHMYFLDICYAISKHGQCLRGNFGAIIVKDGIIIGTGFNGPAKGVPYCRKCRRANHIPGEGYNLCIAVHAEINAILDAAKKGKSSEGATMYVDSHNRQFRDDIVYNKGMGWFPCDNCARAIVNADIEWVVVRKTPDKPSVFHIPSCVKKGLIE